jgi:uncharacterized cupin superfamily protein
METRLGRLLDVVPQVGWPTPIRAERFAGFRGLALGRPVGVNQFGVNHVTLAAGSYSALRHWHEGEDEFVYVISGEVTLIDENGEHVLTEGAFAGFPAGVPNAHHLANRSNSPATFIVVGTRKLGLETIHYPDDPEIGVGVVRRDSNGERVTS